MKRPSWSDYAHWCRCVKSVSIRRAKYSNFQSLLSGGVGHLFYCLSSEKHGNKSIRRGFGLDLFSGFSPEYGEYLVSLE